MTEDAKRAIHSTAALLVLLSLSVVSCSLQPDMPKQYALVYGVADYGPSINGLSLTDDDAVAIRDLLQSRGYDVVFRLSADNYDDPEASTAELPTRAQLVLDLQEAARTLGEDDSFLFYFSGHGGRLDDFAYDGAADESEPYGHEKVAEYLILYNDIGTALQSADPETGNPSIDPDELVKISMKDDDIAELIRRIPSRSKTLVVDACNSGGLIGTSPSYDTYPQEYDGGPRTPGWQSRKAALELYFSTPDSPDADVTYRDAVVLAAAGADELAWENRNLGDGHGVFTYLFLYGARYGDANTDGYITTSEMYRYISYFMDEKHNDVRDSSYDSSGALISAADWKYVPRISGGAVDFVLFPSE